MSRTRKLASAALAAAVVLAGGTAVAGATVVVQKSIAGVELDMTRAEVEALLGAPSEVTRRRSEILGPTYLELRFASVRVSVFDGEQGAVFNVTTTSKRQRTSDGVGVGTTERRLRERVKGETCRTSFGKRMCTVGRFEPGRTVTTFRINASTTRVTRISVGRVID